MALVAVAGWAVGGAVLTYWKHKRRSASTALPGENLCRPIALPEDSPRSELSEPASQWLAAQATPPGRPARSSFGHSPLPLPTATLTQRPLIGGTLVCLYTHAGELLVVKQAGRGWVMEPIPATLQGGQSLSFLPTSSIFMAVRDGQHVGFKSIGAQGCLLQAVKGEDQPHRVTNQNFGSWERWQLVTARGYINQQWGKALGFEVRELRCILTEDMRRFERRHLKERAFVDEQIQTSGQRQRDLEDQVAAVRKAAADYESEMEDMKQRIGEAQQLSYKFKLDAGQKATEISQLRLKLCELASEKQECVTAFEEATRRTARLEADLLSFKVQADRERFLQEQAHIKEMNCLHAQKCKAVASIQASCRQREEAMASMLDQLEQSVTLQAEQIDLICMERDRLDIALQSISGQIESSPEQIGGSCSIPPVIDALKIRELRQALLNAHGLQEFDDQDEDTSPVDQSPSLSESVHQAAHVAKEAEGSGPNDAASKPEIAASSMDAIQRLDDDDDDHSRPQLAHVLSRSSQASHSHCSSSLWPGLGAEKLMQFLNAEASPGSLASARTPRVMTPQLFARMVGENGGVCEQTHVASDS